LLLLYLYIIENLQLKGNRLQLMVVAFLDYKLKT